MDEEVSSRAWSARNGAGLFLRLCLAAAIVLAVLSDARAAPLALGLASEIRTLDPHRATTGAEGTVAAHVFESLVTLDTRSKPLPALATEWVREDDRNWRLTLRQKVRFHDGTALSAEDVALSLDRATKARPELAIGGNPRWLNVTVIDQSHAGAIRSSSPARREIANRHAAAGRAGERRRSDFRYPTRRYWPLPDRRS